VAATGIRTYLRMDGLVDSRSRLWWCILGRV
jgi:hypothetical protein